VRCHADPRERPLSRQQAADQAHLVFRDARSDFLSLIALWEFFAARLAEKLSHRRLVEACRAQYVSYLRLTEWRDVHGQLASEVAEQGFKWNPRLGTIDDARYQAIHQALLAGLLGNIGVKEGDGDAYQVRAASAFTFIRIGTREETPSGCRRWSRHHDCTRVASR
jgi:ATP-dependent helicase HrpA